MAQPSIKTSFASGEWAPKLRGRVDVQKYHAGAALMRNFFVDYSGGGASTRQGFQYIAGVGANGARLIPFQPSSNLSYVLEFGQNYIRFYSNGAQIMSGGIPYQITSPYLASDLFPNPLTGNPGLKFVQDVTSLIITHPNYPAQILTIVATTNWTLVQISYNPTIATPTGLTTASTDAGATTWYYAYVVTTVDQNGQESAPTAAGGLALTHFIGTTVMSNVISWSAVPGAASYNVYKTAPTYSESIPTGALYGFIGNTTALTFTDSYPGIAPDYSQTPPIVVNPFLGAPVTALALTANANYTGTVPSLSIAAPSSGVQATGYLTIGVGAISSLSHAGSNQDIRLSGVNGPIGGLISFANGVVMEILGATSLGAGFWEITSLSNIVNAGSLPSGATIPSNPLVPVSCTLANFISFGSGFGPNVTWHVISPILIQGGSGYTSIPAVTVSSGAATVSATIGMASAGNPSVPGFFQERLMLAGQPGDIQGYNLSQPNSFFNFNVSNPSQDDDAISGTIISEELNDIRSLVTSPTGMITLTGKGAWLINGGGGLSVNNPITPSNQTASAQAFNGANDLKPIKINYDILYGTNKGNYVRDLSYNLYAAIYTGSDISVLSNHLFFGHYIVDWAWSEEPFKTLWAIRDDGQMLSLGYVKEQELTGWAHHDTNGQFLSVCSVIETIAGGNIVDAVYVIVQRVINGSVVQYVERMADRYFPYGYEDSWSVDCGLQTAPINSGTSSSTFVSASGNTGSVTLTWSASIGLTGADIGKVVRMSGGIFQITAVASGSQATATTIRPATRINPYTNVPLTDAQWTGWVNVTNITGLTQLVGASVVGVADGVAVGPFTVSGAGGVTLANAASKVTLGLAYIPQLQTLPLDLGEPTVQGKRKKITGVTLRVADTLGLQIGTTFANAVTMKDFILGNVGTQSNAIVTDFVNGDGRTIIDQAWQEAGSYCIQQNLPYPATILAAMPETVVGDK